jgi:pimeloyl-ACP methyl ester carboxylesterase
MPVRFANPCDSRTTMTRATEPISSCEAWSGLTDWTRLLECHSTTSIPRRGSTPLPYLPIDALNLYYEEMGDPSGVPFVLLHGASSSIDDPVFSWADLMPLFAGAGYRAIHIEHRGHGRTTNPAGRLSYELIATDLCAFIEVLGLAPCHIGGVSDGGIVALHVGMTRPELARTLVTVGPNYMNDDLVREANRFADVASIEANPAAAAGMARRHDRNKYPGYWKELVRHLAENLAVNPAYTLDDLRSIPVPTLLMSGENDLWGNLDQMAAMRRCIPTSELLIVNNGPHEIQHTHAGIVGPVVLDFLARYPGPWK